MAATGARVMMARSVEIARRYGVRAPRAAFVQRQRGHVDRRGGETGAREGDHLRRHARRLRSEGDDRRRARHPGVAARVFRALADAGVNIDMIVQNVSAEGTTDISFTLPKSDLADRRADPRRARCRDRRDGRSTCDDDIAKVSLVGAGMKSHPGVAADMFEALAEAGINIEIISTSSIRDLLRRARSRDVERRCRPSTTSSGSFAEERADA